MCDSFKLVYLKSYVLENANFQPVLQICYLQDRFITFFVIHDRLIYTPNYVLEDDYFRSSDIKHGIVFAGYTVCMLTATICLFERMCIINLKKID